MTIPPDDAFRSNSEAVRDSGEFEFIDRLAGLVSGSTAVVGIGDDAAVLDVGGSDYLLATVDMMVQGVHFECGVLDPSGIGRRAMARSVSDIAAMGGEPTFALISVALPSTCPAEFVERIYRGLAQEAELVNVGIVGGNISRIDGPFCIDVAMVGRVPRGEVVLRSGAQAGDVLAVTGTLGSAAARRLAASDDGTKFDALAALAEKLPMIPAPRVVIARRLAAAHLPRAMLDLSDGLSGDLRQLCRASSVGAVIYEDRLPIAAETRDICELLGVSPVSLALSGGDDYELLMALSPGDLASAQDRAGDIPLTVIGEVMSTNGGAWLVTQSGDRRKLLPESWTHF